MGINYTLPGPDAPGYLKRQRQATALLERLNTEGQTLETLDLIEDFLTPYVDAADDEERRRLLREEASERDFTAMMRGLMNGTGEGVPPPSGAASAPGTEDGAASRPAGRSSTNAPPASGKRPA